MAEILVITPKPVTVTTGSGGSGVAYGVALDLRLAIDVSAWDVIDLSVGFLSVSGTSDATIDFLCGMQADQEDKTWDIKGSGGCLTASAEYDESSNAPTPYYVSVTLPEGQQLLRYMRWRVSASAASTTVTFVVSGLGRRKGS